MARRTRDELTQAVLTALYGKELSINEIARAVHANWKTTHRVLASLQQLGLVEETVSTPKIRLFKRCRGQDAF